MAEYAGGRKKFWRFLACKLVKNKLESSMPFASERPRMPDLELKIEQLTATVSREVLLNLNDYTGTTVLSD